MSASPSHSDDEQTPPDKSTVVLLLSTIGDTTWRMFAPTVGLTIAGLLVDKQLGTTPWLMVIGVVIGAIIAARLVRRQLNEVQKK